MTKAFIVILAIFLICLQFRLWNGAHGSIQDNRRLKQIVQTQIDEIQKLTIRNNQLDAEVQGLKTNPLTFEERARTELGMIKPEETFCLIVEPLH